MRERIDDVGTKCKQSSNCGPINNAVNNTISHSVSRASDAAIAASEFESRVQRLPGGRR